MNTRMLRACLALVASLGLVTVVRLAAWPVVRVTLPPGDFASAARPGLPQTRVVAESIAAIVGHDPFRAGRRALLPAYDPLRLSEQLAPPLPRPTLLLVGVVDGPNPSAVIEGLPGVEGSRVVRVGDVVGGFSIKKVLHGQVVISGMDTTWVLEVREPWKN